MKSKRLISKALTLVLMASFLLSGLSSSAAVQDGDNLDIGQYRIVKSSILGEDRPLSIYVPAGYEGGTDNYPVLYVLYGEGKINVMLAASTMEILDGLSRCPQMIVVGIHSTDSPRDHFPTEVARLPGSGGSDKFLDCITEEIVPWVEANYRTQPYRILYGASNAGLFTTYSYLTRPEAFSAYIAPSPSIGWCTDFMMEKANAFFDDPEGLRPPLYMNYSTDDLESIVLNGAPQFFELFAERAPQPSFWFTEILENEGHIPYISFYNGLQFIFPAWQCPAEKIASEGLDGLKTHFQALADDYGFEVKVPSLLLQDLGYDSYLAEDLETAEEVFRYYTEAHPSIPMSHYLLGAILEKQTDTAAAIECYKKCLELDPEHSRAKAKLDALVLGSED